MVVLHFPLAQRLFGGEKNENLIPTYLGQQELKMYCTPTSTSSLAPVEERVDGRSVFPQPFNSPFPSPAPSIEPIKQPFLFSSSGIVDMAEGHQTAKTANGRVLNYVDHTYHNFSKFFEAGGEVFRHKKAGKNFPAMLHKILSEETKYSHIITWMVCFWSE